MSAEAIVITNDKNPIKSDFIAMLHQAALHNQLGYMDGMDPDTKEIVPLLVGVERNEGKVIGLWPLAAAFLKGEDLKNYLVPDGNGNYFDQHGVDLSGDPIEGPVVDDEPVKPKRSRKRKAKE